MGATYQRRGKRSWMITVHSGGHRERKTIHGTEQDAKDLVRWIHKQELGGVNVVEAIRKAQVGTTTLAVTTPWPRLRDALPAFIAEMAAKGEWTGSTPSAYRRRLTSHVYDFEMADGRKLGDVTVEQVTEPMIGAVLDHVRRHKKSLALQEQIRSPLRRFYRDLIRKQGFPGPNPAADLKDWMSKNPSKRARAGRITYFRQEEGPQLFGTATAAFPRWLAFIGSCTLAGLRWGEAAALERDDIDFKKFVIHVQRTVVDKTGEVKITKDGEDRYVPLSRQLAEWLRLHLDAISLRAR